MYALHLRFNWKRWIVNVFSPRLRHKFLPKGWGGGGKSLTANIVALGKKFKNMIKHTGFSYIKWQLEIG